MANLKNYIKRALTYIYKGIPNILIKANIETRAATDLLRDKVVLITGGSSGIGKAIAKEFLKAGAKVIITGRDHDKLEKTLLELKKISNSIYIQCLDITSVSSFSKKIQEAELIVGERINVLVNNAGIIQTGNSDGEESDFECILATNLTGTVFLSKEIANYFIQNGIKGNILNITSTSGIRPAISAYHISKWGLRGFTLGLAKKLIKHGIVVNGIAPGPTATPMLKAADDNNLYHPTNPSGRYTTPEEVANVAVLLVSNMGRQIIGDIIYISGGAGIITYDDITY